MCETRGRPSVTPLIQKMQDISSTFEREGYIVLPGMVSKAKLADLTNKLRSEFARTKEKGELFSGGGTISGHLTGSFRRRQCACRR